MSRRLPLHALCPYFAMFPEEFVRAQIEAYSAKGDWVFDPFCGRGTTVLEALLMGRNAAGSDINPVAYCVAHAKAERPAIHALHRRIAALHTAFRRSRKNKWETERLALTPFFRRAFHPSTLRELLFLRSSLKWRQNTTDRFIAALVLGSLHGEMDRSSAYFSNQMPRTICLKPEYSLHYWRVHRLYPKKRKVFEMLLQKTDYRLGGLPACPIGEVRMVDAREVATHFDHLSGQVSLVVTSPPYLNVTCYEEDQWLRLWFLGGKPNPTYGAVSQDDRHNSPTKYWQFLKESWVGMAPLLRDSAKLVIRLGAIGITEREITDGIVSTIRGAYPHASMVVKPTRSRLVHRQATNFLPSSKGCLYEMDYVFRV